MPMDDYDFCDNEEIPQPTPYAIRECSSTQRIFSVYLSREIGEPHQYIDLLEKLRLGQPTDVFYLYLNTPGGYVNTGAQIIHAIRDTQARVVGVLDGTVCSMGALIFLACREFIVHDYSQLMFHNYSGGVVGKGHEQIAHLNATTQWYTNMLVDVCTPFLCEQEITNVLSGQDLWLAPDDVRQRLEKMATEHKREMDKLEREFEKQMAAVERAAKEAQKAPSKKKTPSTKKKTKP